MGVIRTALAVGALVISVPVYAQPGRYGGDRSRADRGGDARNGARQDRRAEPRAERRDGGRMTPRADARPAPRVGERNDRRGGDGAMDRGTTSRYGVPDFRGDRRDRRDVPRVAVRPPVVIDRYDHRSPRYAPPVVRYGRPMPYRYGDRDFRQRELFAITAWFHALPPARLAAYGYYGPGYGGIRYAFRSGLYLSMAVSGQLGLLPYDLEVELGELPWYLERRIYGNTVLVIDTRTRLVVDMFDIDF